MWDRPIEGLLITTGLTLIVANAFDLGSIALTGSTAFLIIFAAVNAAAVRLATRWMQRALAVTAAAAGAASLVALILNERSSNPRGLVIVSGLVAGLFASEGTYRSSRGARSPATLLHCRAPRARPPLLGDRMPTSDE